MKLKGTKILVTGGMGLIGSHIIDQLIQEHPAKIICFDKNLPDPSEARFANAKSGIVEIIHGDISRPDEVREVLKGIEFVFHTASLLNREGAESPRKALEVNICGTLNLIEGGIASGVKKIIYSSSASIYGDPAIEQVTEEYPFSPKSVYGATKASSELLLGVFKKTKGLDYIALRYSAVYGPWMSCRGNITRCIPESFDRISLGLPPVIYGSGLQPYDYVFVEDVARANILSLKSPVSGRAFNIGTGSATTVEAVVWMIVEITETPLTPIRVPQGEQFEYRHMNIDVTQAKKMIGFRSMVSLREGLMRYDEWRKMRDQSNKSPVLSL